MIVFDTETTGLPKAEASPLSMQPQIIEFAAVKLNDELEEVDTLEFMCKPTVKLPKKITEITGITDADLEDKDPFVAHLSKLSDFFLGERSMAAHNMPFDRSLMKFELLRLDKMMNFPWPPEHICTVESSYHIRGHRLSLSKLHMMATGEEFEGAHRALVDTRALVRCVKWLYEEGHLQ